MRISKRTKICMIFFLKFILEKHRINFYNKYSSSYENRLKLEKRKKKNSPVSTKTRNPSIIRKHVGNLTNLIGMPLDPDNFSTFAEKNAKKKETWGILDNCHANVDNMGFFLLRKGWKLRNNCTDDSCCIECND